MKKLSLDLSVTQYFGVNTPPPKFKDHYIYAGHSVSGHGRHRLISAPNTSMLAIHRCLVKQLRARKIYCPSATGCRAGDSPWKNVIRHRLCNERGYRYRFPRYFYVLDLKSAYKMVDKQMLIEAICFFFPQQDKVQLEYFLTAYCFHPTHGGLYTGSPSSPDLFNLYCEYFLDGEIRQICKSYQLVYSRYLDDLTFSAQQPIGNHKRKAICALIRKAGFEVSVHKVKIYDLQKGNIAINGIGIRPNGTTFLPRKNAQEISGFIHQVSQKLLSRWCESKRFQGELEMTARKQVLALHAHDISTVFGMMGLFFSTLGKDARLMSGLERRVVVRYEIFRHLLSELQSCNDSDVPKRRRCKKAIRSIKESKI